MSADEQKDGKKDNKTDGQKTLRVHSVETLGALDGPGIRTVIFLCGCPLNCKYCHNPDICRADGESRTVTELADFCERYVEYYGKDGGVTLSGGEPLMQADGVCALINELRRRGICTAIDTGGGVFAPEALKSADLVILDVKHAYDDEFYALTGKSSEQMHLTLDYLKRHKIRFWVRQVTVPGITDGEDQVRALVRLAAGAERIELLPYHTMGVAKWQKLGLSYPLAGVQPPSDDVMRRLKEIINRK